MQQTLDNPPDYLKCMICLGTFNDPITVSDGQTYCRTCLRGALGTQPVSPHTRQPMSQREVETTTTNYGIRSAVEAWLDAAVTTASAGAAAARRTATAAPGMMRLRLLESSDGSGSSGSGSSSSSERVVSLAVDPDVPLGPRAIHFVLDYSGSMFAMPANIGHESTGLSRWDSIVMCAITAFSALRDRDTFSLTLFSDSARCLLPPTPATESNKQHARRLLNGVATGGRTNIWAGLQQALHYVRDDDNTAAMIFLLTDGEPNLEPADGTLVALRNMQSECPRKNFVLFTSVFGSGMDLASDLLRKMSQNCGAMAYFFDAGMAGSGFVHLVSAFLNAAATNVHIEFRGRTVAKLPLAVAGATYTFLAGTDDGAAARVEDLVMSMHNFSGQHTISTEVVPEAERLAQALRIRDILCQRIRSAFRNAECGLSKGGDYSVTDLPLPSPDDDVDRMPPSALKTVWLQVFGLCTELAGQVSMGLADTKTRTSWGKHHLHSLLSVVDACVCPHAKSPATVAYKSDRVTTTAALLDGIMTKVFADQAQRLKQERGVQVSRMVHTLSNADHPCVLGTALVHMANGDPKKARCVAPDDEVMTPAGPARVEGVIHTRVEPGASLCTLATGLVITPWHPVVASDGRVVFPHDVAEREWETTEPTVIVSFMLDVSAPSAYMIIDNTHVITQGSPRVTPEDGIAYHPFFSNRTKLLGFYEQATSWRNANALFFRGAAFLRDPVTGEYYAVDMSKAA